MKRSKIIFGIIFIFCILIVNTKLSSQQFNVFNIDTTEFPTMKAMFYANTPAGKAYADIVPENFDVWENGILMNPSLRIDCDEVPYFPPVAVHFMLDASTSMGENAGDGSSRLKWIKDGINVFLDTIKLVPPSEVAALSFAGQVKNYSGFVDADSMRRWADKALTVEFGSTDFGPPFVQKTSFANGALFNLATRDPNLRRVAIFMSDGLPERTFTNAVIDSIVRVAKREKIQVYAIFITSNMDSDIRYICEQTGGRAFQVWKKENLLAVFREIVGEIQNTKQCKLVWTAPYGCDEQSRLREVKAIFKRIPDSVTVKYIAPTTSIANVTLSDNLLKFGTKNGGTTRQELKLTSQVTQVTITGYSILPDGSKFTIDWNGKNPPLVIDSGTSHTIFVDYIEDPVTSSSESILYLQGTPCNPEPVALVAPCGGKFTSEISFGDVALQTTKDIIENCIYKNTTPIPITGNVKLSGVNSSEFDIVQGAGIFTLEPGECLEVTVRFKPATTPGVKTAKLEYSTDSDCGPAETVLTGNAIQTDFPMPTLDFGRKRVLSDNTLQYEIKNSTNAPITISSIALQNPGDNNFSLSNIPSVPLNLDVNASIFVDVTFTPHAEFVQENFIDVVVESISGIQSGRLTGFGTLPQIIADDLVFVPTVVQTTSTQNLVIKNVSTTEDLKIANIFMPVNPDFKFATGTTLTNLTVNMNDGNITLPIEFTPQSSGQKSVLVIIRSDAITGNPPYNREDTVEIRGIGLGLDITPTTHNYGSVMTCGYNDRTFTINNTSGTQTINITSISVVGTGAGSFAVLGPLPTSVPVGATANFVVRFAPQSIGNHNATLEVITDGGDASIPLLGIGSTVNVRPNITKPTEKILPGTKYPLNFAFNVPSLDGGQLSQMAIRIAYYGKAYNFENNTGDLITPALPGWNWIVTYDNVSNELYLNGSGPNVNPSVNLQFTVNLTTFLSDYSQTKILVNTVFPGLSCINSVPDTLGIEINTCYTEGRLVNVSEYDYAINEISPNPVSSDFNLRFSIGLDSRTQINIFNYLGEPVASVMKQDLKKGEYEINVPIGELPNGVYFLRMESGHYSKVKKLVINK